MNAVKVDHQLFPFFFNVIVFFTRNIGVITFITAFWNNFTTMRTFRLFVFSTIIIRITI